MEQLTTTFERPALWERVLQRYGRALADLTSGQLVRALDTLERERTSHRFPLPAEIRKAAGDRDQAPDAILPGSVLPLGWEPELDDRYYATTICKLDLDATIAAFKEAWHGKVAKFSDNDWSAAWRTWCKQQVQAARLLEQVRVWGKPEKAA